MGLLDSGTEEPRSKGRRYAVTVVAFALLMALAIWYLLRFYPEKRAAEHFFDALATGDAQRAYQLWHPQPTYSYQDFLDDWGPTGYYGPVKSYRIESVQAPPKGGSGVIVVAELSPFQPFPADNDGAKNRRTKEVRIWVEHSDKSLSFPP